MTQADLEAWLKADGWPLERLDANTWRTGFAADGTSYRLFVKTTANWLVLTIVPFVQLPEDDAQSLATFRRMLELNREITLAKLAVNGRDVILTVELTLAGIDWPHLKDGVDAITYYAGNLHAELSAMTTTAPATPVREGAAMAEALSPAGDRHPGEILFEDKVENRTYSERATDVPVTIAWVKLEARWVPVVNIVITGAGQMREITNFGPNGQILNRTIATIGPPSQG